MWILFKDQHDFIWLWNQKRAAIVLVGGVPNLGGLGKKVLLSGVAQSILMATWFANSRSFSLPEGGDCEVISSGKF